MADTTVAKLNERFATGGQALEPDVVMQLQSIMKMHGLPVQELFYKWEAYCIKMDLEAAAMSMERLRAFKQDLQDALERRNQEQQPSLSVHKKPKSEVRRLAATQRNAAKQGGVFDMLDGLVPGTSAKTGGNNVGSGKKSTPSVSRVKSEYMGSSPDHKTPSKLADQLGAMGAIAPSSFNDRQNAGDVIEILNRQLPAAERPIAPYAEPRVKLTGASDQKKLGYKPMAMKLSEASEILDDRIDEFTKLVLDHHKLDDDEIGNAASQGTAEIVAVGRIASDSASGKLNAASAVLETSRRRGGGLRVPLDLGRLKGFQFFPGQIVALRGTNSSGHAFAVSQVLELPLLPNAASSLTALMGHREKMRGHGGGDGDEDDMMDVDGNSNTQNALAPLNIIYASGPYTADDNLDFEPLHALCSKAADTGVDAVVLAGPFLDADHPLIATGDFDLPEDAVVEPDAATMATVFRYLVAPALQQLTTANPAVMVLLVPSVRDVLDRHVSWPQDAFSRRDLGLPKAVRIVGNPMTLSINEMVLGVSSQDVLYELRHEELSGGRLADANAMSRACRYLLEQRHYFPLFPPVDRRSLPRTGVADTDFVATGAMLDTSYLKLGEMVNVRPDVLVVPSALPPFARVVESVLVINPGYLSKRRGAGTYARMTLYPPAVDSAALAQDGEQMVGHGIFERARVEIIKI
ncbi:DNA polymerase alpha primase associated subunit [Grosmannia clavigera kw1407]|uniref:DNA polymerase alpha subunit B n=1 Tax=Grosmannia clavigera (strain kw1407 / UAMH 11150) TaxID=655863 RepID=F0XCA0_GROCL|nr:DNA polymerase alpha primase associated subunit [Grosmannia clavigera kw1407]EFX04114.1 DNA polymerase alpha primase associated subunit [Grosmannia clavigera kw1407]